MTTVRGAALRTGMLIGIVGLNVMVNCILSFRYFNENIDTGAGAYFIDEYHYVDKARRLAEDQSFEQVFRDGYHPPAYSAALSVLMRFHDQPVCLARVLQIFGGGAIVLLMFFLLRRLTHNWLGGLIGASVAALWPPLHFFARALYPEMPSLVIVALVLGTLSFTKSNPVAVAVCAGVSTGILTLLKANQLLVAAPCLAALCCELPERRSKLRAAVAFMTALTAIVSPWSLWISAINDACVPLTTAGGYNLYWGTGELGVHGENPANPSIAYIAATRLGLYNKKQYDRISSRTAGMPRMADRSRAFRKRAVRLWLKRPVRTILFGAAKALHAFGMSFRTVRDAVILLHAAFAGVVSILLWKMRRWRRWVVLFWAAAAATVLQAFVFLPAQRFKTVLFDLPALVIISLGLYLSLSKLLMPGARASAM